MSAIEDPLVSRKLHHPHGAPPHKSESVGTTPSFTVTQALVALLAQTGVRGLAHRSPSSEALAGKDTGFCFQIRDWSLITGRGRLLNGKIAGPKLFAPPLMTEWKLFVPPTQYD